MRSILAAAACLLLIPVAGAQTSVPPNQVDKFLDTSMLKPPAGERVAVIEFEDLECPHCGHAAPIVRAAVEKNHVAYQHHDFPIHQGVWWSLNAAISARYLQDTAGNKVAEQFRLDVFSHQNQIANEDDLSRFTKQWFAAHHIKQPAKFDQRYKDEVMADFELGIKIGLNATPTIFVVTANHWTEVKDVNQLDATIQDALKSAPPATAHNNVRQPAHSMK